MCIVVIQVECHRNAQCFMQSKETAPSYMFVIVWTTFKIRKSGMPVFLLPFFFILVVRFELRALHLIHWHSTTWSTLPALSVLVIFEIFYALVGLALVPPIFTSLGAGLMDVHLITLTSLHTQPSVGIFFPLVLSFSVGRLYQLEEQEWCLLYLTYSP
jgi:hypothetical protein